MSQKPVFLNMELSEVCRPVSVVLYHIATFEGLVTVKIYESGLSKRDLKLTLISEI